MRRLELSDEPPGLDERVFIPTTDEVGRDLCLAGMARFSNLAPATIATPMVASRPMTPMAVAIAVTCSAQFGSDIGAVQRRSWASASATIESLMRSSSRLAAASTAS